MLSRRVFDYPVAEVVAKIVNLKGLDGLKDAVVGALQKAGGNPASYEGTDRKFNYFGLSPVISRPRSPSGLSSFR